MRFLFGDCVLDPTRRELCRGGETVHIEPQVFDLLLHFVRNRDQVISKEDMLAAVWGGRIVSESTLSNRINAARRAIGDSGEQQGFIRTVPRRGLRFVADVREEPKQSVGAHHADAQQASSRRMGAGPEVSNTSVSPSQRPYEVRGKPTVAVLPFDNMSGDPEQDYFSDGISEDIITLLSKHRALFVIARNSAFALKGSGRDVRDIGRKLGADYGARNVPLSKLKRELSKLDRNAAIVAYCRGPYCVLSFEAVAQLRKMGFKARRLEDGLPEWKAAGLPVESSNPH